MAWKRSACVPPACPRRAQAPIRRHAMHQAASSKQQAASSKQQALTQLIALRVRPSNEKVGGSSSLSSTQHESACEQGMCSQALGSQPLRS